MSSSIESDVEKIKEFLNKHPKDEGARLSDLLRSREDLHPRMGDLKDRGEVAGEERELLLKAFKTIGAA